MAFTLSPYSTYYHVIDQVCFKEESGSYGTPPSGSYTFIAPQAAFIPEYDLGAIQVRPIGTRTGRNIVDGAHIGGFTLRFNPYNSTLLKYAFNTGSGTGSVTGTIDKSLTFVTRIVISGSQYVMWIPGCRIERATIALGAGGLLQGEVYCVGILPMLSGSVPASNMLTWPSDPGTAPWSFVDGGTTPFIISGSSVYTPNVNRLRAAARNNVTPLFVLGKQNPIENPPMESQVQLVWTQLMDSITSWQAATGSMDLGAYWILKSGTSVMTLTGSKITRLLNQPHVVGAVSTETWGLDSNTCTLS